MIVRTACGELDCCHWPPGLYSSGWESSLSGSIANATSSELVFGNVGVSVLVVVAGATLMEGRNEVVHWRSLLPSDALGTAVVAGSHAWFAVLESLRSSFCSDNSGSSSASAQLMAISEVPVTFSRSSTYVNWCPCTFMNFFSAPSRTSSSHDRTGEEWSTFVKVTFKGDRWLKIIPAGYCRLWNGGRPLMNFPVLLM